MRARQNNRIPAAVVVVIAALALTAGLIGAQSGRALASTNLVAFDIAEIGPRFAFDDQFLQDVEGMSLPAYGNAFVTQGYIYPAGTLAGSTNGGVNADGSPEFPDRVLGIWTCSGWHVGDGATSTGEPWVVTTQLYALDGPTDEDQLGGTSIVTYGYELPDVGRTVTRAVIGGTGEHSNVRGDQAQTLLGFNASNGVNLSVVLRVH